MAHANILLPDSDVLMTSAFNPQFGTTLEQQTIYIRDRALKPSDTSPYKQVNISLTGAIFASDMMNKVRANTWMASTIYPMLGALRSDPERSSRFIASYQEFGAFKALVPLLTQSYQLIGVDTEAIHQIDTPRSVAAIYTIVMNMIETRQGSAESPKELKRPTNMALIAHTEQRSGESQLKILEAVYGYEATQIIREIPIGIDLAIHGVPVKRGDPDAVKRILIFFGSQYPSTAEIEPAANSYGFEQEPGKGQLLFEETIVRGIYEKLKKYRGFGGVVSLMEAPVAR